MPAHRRLLRGAALTLAAIRPGRDADAAAVLALIGRCWADYPGCVLDLEGAERGLLAPASHYRALGGALFVAEAAEGGAGARKMSAAPAGPAAPAGIGALADAAAVRAALGGRALAGMALAGMAAVRPAAGEEDRDGGPAWEVCRVYVHPDLHGSGLAHALLDRAEAHGRAHGARRLYLWSDTRFGRAHRFYVKRGYRPGGRRALADLSGEECRFDRPA